MMSEEKVGLEALGSLVSYAAILPIVAGSVALEYFWLRIYYKDQIPASREYAKAVFLRVFIFILGLEFLGKYENVLRFASVYPWMYWVVLGAIVFVTVFIIRKLQAEDTAMPEKIFTLKYLLVSNIVYTAYLMIFDLLVYRLID